MEREITLELEHVEKVIRGKRIIKGISFCVHAGEVFGFLGPNGSGKTTTIRMMVGLIRPTAGRIKVCGYDIQKQPTKALANVGSIVENPELYPYLTGMENLEHFARMIPGVTKEKIDDVVLRVNLNERIHDKVKDYSLGMRQRLGIAQALLGDPKLLILDEPTNGLDPQGIKELRDFIRQLANEGLSVFVSSHLLSEIQLMCDRVAIINEGEMIRVGEVNELLKQDMRHMVWYVEPEEKARRILTAFSHVRLLDRADEGMITEIAPEHIPRVIARLVAGGVDIYGVEWKKLSLEDLFLTMTGEK
ncbi:MULTISPECIES: ABC transporter ATP-binding protein [Aneurinibacillus]|uniref:ABC transporter ATP-binding protein n=1 Tax=Aneurinibacillus thermoaerophilus TaxID=143495 RepID=A0A1G7XSN1_ANETH|nr:MULTISPECIES: ABC transporter ATP-binding protein [Aneurinibacillus]AMA73732.1 ABC transporter ATP-binding protein [Aneurinibacillus sp. XH2]MED0677084.1 ABC transporter ATP-binding protein [Aneurinibacillus thermoaerophilus]MED0679457.1 ABC transporter ATP-binding protein [Aneurinibacillus thermoaerophilus]MED0737972.1 ABC transporter ATP-binding protein [Aneurinibacillus thermoaerophilus]MED0756394.1 ABC transporter ATP-binding protein [Aneurinibacillus thermoaerophilus]